MKDQLIYEKVCCVQGHDYRATQTASGTPMNGQDVLYCSQCGDIKELTWLSPEKAQAA